MTPWGQRLRSARQPRSCRCGSPRNGLFCRPHEVFADGALVFRGPVQDGSQVVGIGDAIFIMAVQQFLLLDVAETVLPVEHVLLAAAATVSATGVSLAISAAGAQPAFTGGPSLFPSLG